MPDDGLKTPQLATSEAIPRAVEYLINVFVRVVCFVSAGAFGLIALLGILREWTAWFVLPASAFAITALVCGLLIRPRGRMVFDSKGPSVIVPRE